MISITNGSHHMPTTISTLFVVSKDKECIVRMYSGVTKGTSWAEATSSSKKSSL